jgi:GNAT superfamily N-acetyltransferase
VNVMKEQPGLSAVTIRPFQDKHDASQVRELFMIVNRLLSPPNMREAFEAYIARSLSEEMDRTTAYYRERGGGFWVALREEKVVGMFGLEPAAPDAMELRRMYVDPPARRGGIARLMLREAVAEQACNKTLGGGILRYYFEKVLQNRTG